MKDWKTRPYIYKYINSFPSNNTIDMKNADRMQVE